MEKIIELPPNIAEKIAAGEVVTDPASAVKELVENSMDAGAGAVTVEIRNGGKSFLRVTDNGAGIPAGQIRTAFLRHATSKLRSLSDLDRINTLGFRGEALTSIAAVSRLELYTKTADAVAGAMIRIEGGEVVSEKPVGTADGTTVVVSDLFFNTPARLKFMKSDRAESARVIDAVSKLSLSRADVKIRLISNGSVLFSTQGRGDTAANILTVYGANIGRDLLPLNAAEGGLSVSGYVSPPSAPRGSGRKTRILFINGRSVHSRLIEKALTEAYRETPLEGAVPVAILFLRVPPERLDVNIHPAKSEVRFDDAPALTAFIVEAVRASVRSKEAIPTVKPGAGRVVAPFADDGGFTAAGQLAFDGAAPRVSVRNSHTENEVDIKYLLSTKREESAGSAVNLMMEDAEEPPIFAEERVPGPFDPAAVKPIGRIFSTYILGRDDDSFYFADQHAAHERVLYERFLRQYLNREKLCQQLLTPLVVELPHAARATSADDEMSARDFLAGLGYEAEDFGSNACRVCAVPAFLPLSEAEDFLRALLDGLPGGRPPRNRAAAERVISAACKAAVKAGDRLGDAEIEALLADLAVCENPYACPHGRPVFIRLTKRDIERMFGRR
jgi:DNA mismatch repair protein MutL